MRINLRTGEMRENSRPLNQIDGFDWTEDFDGKIVKVDGTNVWINLKMVCNAGGAQTRSLREVYHFVEGQLRVLSEQPTPKSLFVNILDGNESHKHKSKFRHLLESSGAPTYRSNIFVGDMCEFREWWRETNEYFLRSYATPQTA